ncbi:hypothetical protein DPEC_G00370200 [Dallia pectoralis]|nr:hypothetical protein DPEC_G00370200 [Dallia pectoralis]
MGDSSPAHHTTSSGFSRAESAGGSSDVTAGLGFHRPPSLLNEVSPSFSSSTVEKSVIANPFRGSLPMGCTSATDGQRLRGRDVLIRSDNRATVAYINRQGGVRSPVLHEAATRLWLWAHRHLRSLSAVHVPGRQNVGADLMSRGGPRDDDWRLNPEIVSLIWERFGEARADLFAARENAQCRLWFSLRAQDGPPLGTDAFAHHSWPKGLLYAFPPLSCLARLLARVKADHLTVIVVAPDLPGRYGIRK